MLVPTQLRVKLPTGEKTFATLMSAAALLKKLRIEVRCGEKRDMVLPTSDLKALLQEGDETNSKD